MSTKRITNLLCFYQTLVDAIDVCRNLGIPYLWVDAICIIQNDEEDWEEQSSKMQYVYSNCFLALAVEDTADCGLGFLPRLPSYAIGETQVTGNQDEMMRIWSGKWRCEFSQMALSARGWTLQERILPSRTLRFTSSGMTWECNQAFEALNEASTMDILSLNFRAMRLEISGRQDVPAPARFRNLGPNLADDGEDISHRDVTSLLTSGSYQAMYYAWYSIVEHYSSRTLTKPADKLVALSGLASLLASSIPGGPDDYLAGIWRERLAESLLWHVEEPCARFPTYIAPSWSWASRNSKISYLRERNQFQFESNINIMESVCKKSLLDPTGSVSGGHIRLVGEVVPVHLLVLSSSSEESSGSRYRGWGGHFGSAYKDQLIFVHPFGTSGCRHWEALCDERMPFTTECKVNGHLGYGCKCYVKSNVKPKYFCLDVGRMVQWVRRWDEPHRKLFRHWWLLLEILSSSNQLYRRIGIGYVHRGAANYFKSAETRAITII